MTTNPSLSEHQQLTLWALLTLAIPSILSALLNNGFRIIDQYFVQWLGTPAQAALGSTTFFMLAAFSLFILVSAGVAPLIGRSIGAKNPQECSELVGQSMLLMVGVSLFFCGLLIVGAPYFGGWIGIYGEAAHQMELYLWWLGISGFFLAFGPLIDGIYIASGNTKFPMLLQGLSTIANGILNWWLIYVLEWGIAGAAVASGLSRALASIVGLYYLHREFRPIWQGWHHVQRIIRIGTPVSLGLLSYSLVYWAMLKVAISPLGEEVNAALGIGFSALEGTSWPIFAGIMMAASSLISRQLGANDIKGLQRTLHLTYPVATVVGIIIAFIFYFGAEFLCGQFTTDPLVLKQAVLYAQILAFSQVFTAWEALAEGILEGAGDTKTVLWYGLPYNILRIPLSWFLAIYLGWGAMGIWWTVNISTMIKAILKSQAVFKGEWRHLKI